MYPWIQNFAFTQVFRLPTCYSSTGLLAHDFCQSKLDHQTYTKPVHSFCLRSKNGWRVEKVEQVYKTGHSKQEHTKVLPPQSLTCWTMWCSWSGSPLHITSTASFSSWPAGGKKKKKKSISNRLIPRRLICIHPVSQSRTANWTKQCYFHAILRWFDTNKLPTHSIRPSRVSTQPTHHPIHS